MDERRACLTPAEFMVLRAREEGWGYGEIAAQLGLSGPYLRAIADRARTKLRRLGVGR